MRSIVFCVVCLPLAWGYANSRGVGAFSFSDSSGRRYGGTYDVKDGQVVSSTGNFPPGGSFPSAGSFPVPFADAYQGIRHRRTFLPPLPPLEPFKPFKPFKPLKPLKPLRPFRPLNRRAFDSNIENQKLALNAARKAFDFTSYQADFIPHFGFRLQPFNDFPGPNEFGNMQNSAFASAAAGPGFSHQVAAISPGNPEMPNVNKVNKFSEAPAQGGFYQVSSKSFASSSNINGKELTSRGAETVVNDNGKVTKYEVKS